MKPDGPVNQLAVGLFILAGLVLGLVVATVAAWR